MRSTEIVNCKIGRTELGLGDRGGFHFWLMLSGNSWGCGFGGLRADAPGLDQCLTRILKTVGVERWEQLPGQFIRAEFEGIVAAGIKRIGHLLEDKWVSLEELSSLLRGEK